MKERNKEKIGGNFGYIGKINRWRNLRRIWPVGIMHVDVITYAVFGNYQLRDVGQGSKFTLSH